MSAVGTRRGDGAAAPWVAVIGGGPAGLAAAEALAQHARVTVFEAKPSLGRKFLLAGRSGLNLTHAEPFERFLMRFGAARNVLEPALRDLPPFELRRWSADLGIETFTGSSGRVFPVMMKASPLLRAWIARLEALGVRFELRQRWCGWAADGALQFETPAGIGRCTPQATVLTLGGGSWPRLGSDARWIPLLAARGIRVAPLRPANCGFDVRWTDHLRERFAGTPVKTVGLTACGYQVRGDFVISEYGIEGSAIYAIAADLRDGIEQRGTATLQVDLTPDRSMGDLTAALGRPRRRNSLANHLRKTAGLTPVKLALLRDVSGSALPADPAQLAARIKALPLTLLRPRPIEEAISSAGGIALEELDGNWMLRKLPGVFAAGEMLDWEAPTGGYLLNACIATGRAAGCGAVRWLGIPTDARQ
jgi:uncharacterized flavoprotein (TIGR03862 family)